MNALDIHSDYASQARSVLDRPLAACANLSQNVGDPERTVSTVGGAVLLLAGLVSGKTTGLLLSVLGGGLLYRGLTGHCHLYEAMGVDTAECNTAMPSQRSGL